MLPLEPINLGQNMDVLDRDKRVLSLEVARNLCGYL